MLIREATADDLDSLLEVERRAFGGEEEAALVRALLDDPTADPSVSLVAIDHGRCVGHILLTAARVAGAGRPVSASILAPLAVLPETQGNGVGTKLVEAGLARLSKTGTEMVFVLGHPGYYPRFGFEPTGRLGLQAPHPIPRRNEGAWMVRALDEAPVSVSGHVECAASLDRAEHWHE